MSAENMASSTLAAVCGDRVRVLQHVLYRAAKADPDRRFHALSDKVLRRDVLDRAWEDVRQGFVKVVVTVGSWSGWRVPGGTGGLRAG